MITVSAREEQMNRLSQQNVRPEFTLADGMMASAEESLLSGIGASLVRGAKNLFDNSEEIPAEEANELYGFSGTEAEVPAGTMIQRGAAEARNEDLFRKNFNDFTQEVVNEDSPIIGRASQLLAGFAGAMADPAMIALNVVGAGAISAAGKALVSGGRAINTIGRISPQASNTLIKMYGANHTRSLMQVAMREGVENLVTSVAEEGVAYAIDQGNDRIAVKAGAQERIMNVLAGTFIGTGLGTGMSREGRSALARRFGRTYGDSAEARVPDLDQVRVLEEQAGIQNTGFVERLFDIEDFEARPWHDTEYKFNESSPAPSKVYVPIGEDGGIIRVTNRGEGITATDNKVHAYNKSTKFREIDLSEMNMFDSRNMLDAEGRATPQGTDVINKVIDNIVEEEGLARFTNVVRTLFGEDDTSPIVGKRALKKAVKEYAEKHRMTMDDFVDFIDKAGIVTDKDLNVDSAISDALKAHGYDGYHFKGKDSKGEGRYRGTQIFDTATQKAKMGEAMDSPQAKGAADSQIWKNRQDEELAKYSLALQEGIKKGKLKSESIPDMPNGDRFITDPVTPAKDAVLDGADANVSTNRTAINEPLLAGKETDVELYSANLDREIEGIKVGEDGDTSKLTKAQRDALETKRILDAIKNGESAVDIMSKDADKVKNYIGCILGR